MCSEFFLYYFRFRPKRARDLLDEGRLSLMVAATGGFLVMLGLSSVSHFAECHAILNTPPVDETCTGLIAIHVRSSSIRDRLWGEPSTPSSNLLASVRTSTFPLIFGIGAEESSVPAHCEHSGCGR